MEDSVEVQERTAAPRTDKPPKTDKCGPQVTFLLLFFKLLPIRANFLIQEDSFTKFEEIETPARPLVVLNDVKEMVCEGKPINSSLKKKGCIL